MVVKIRLWRCGRRNLPFYRVVATNARTAPQGKFIEILGTYQPWVDVKTGSKFLRLKSDRVKYWLAVGAQPSDTMARLLGKVNLLPPAPVRSLVPKWRVLGLSAPPPRFPHNVDPVLPSTSSIANAASASAQGQQQSA